MTTSAVPGDHHTTTALSDSRLNEIRSVQPGCWYSGQWMVRHPDGNTGRVEIVHTDSLGDTVIARMPDFLDAMAHFLVDARTAVPELLTEVEKLRAENSMLLGEVAQLGSELAALRANTWEI